MTRGKPLIFSRENEGNNSRVKAKREAEERVKAGALPKSPPAELADMPAAKAAWRELTRAADALPAPLFNGLDRASLVGYCLARQAREDAKALALQVHKAYTAGDVELKSLLAVRVELRQASRLAADLEKQLYLSPKSRAGVNPEPRELSEEEKLKAELDNLENLLGD
jgi:phage terminase small subunit